MKKMISLLLIGLALSSCSLFQIHKMDIEQGNIISTKETSQLRLGMNESEVKDIMGSPILINIFSESQVNYVYTLQEGHDPMKEKRVTCIFRHGRLYLIDKA